MLIHIQNLAVALHELLLNDQAWGILGHEHRVFHIEFQDLEGRVVAFQGV